MASNELGNQVVRDPKTSEPDKVSKIASVDIVAVPGIGGRSTDSRRSLITGLCWLNDFLKYDLPGARIMTFGYRTDANFRLRTIAEQLVTDICIHREGEPALSAALGIFSVRIRLISR